MKVVVIIGKSESGDDYGPWVFDKKPSERQLHEFLKTEAEGEFNEDEDGPGAYGSYLHISIHEAEVLEKSKLRLKK